MSSKLTQWKWHMRLLNTRLLWKLRRALGIDFYYPVTDRVDQYRNYWESAARLIGAEFVPLSKTFWDVRRGNARTRIHIWNVQLNDVVTNQLMVKKALCCDLAEKAGVPIPRHLVFRLEHLAKAELLRKEIGGFWVLKPAGETSAGQGITTQIHTQSQLRRAALLSSLYADEVLMEQMAPGESYRLLFLEGKMIHAVRRGGVRVKGDGKSTIRQLVLAQSLPAATLDANTLWTLKAQGLSPDSIPDANRDTLIRSLPLKEARTRELRTVYTETVTDLISPAIISEIRPVLDVLGATFAGVDVVTLDPTISLRKSGGVFLEANPGPGIHHNYISDEDSRSHPVAVAILQALLTRSELAGTAAKVYKAATQ